MSMRVTGETPGAALASPGPSPIARRLVAFTPLWVSLILFVASPTYFTPLFMAPPEIQGVPFGLVLAGLAMILMLVGALLVWDARSRLVEILGLFLFTIPATLLLVTGPGLVLIVQNLG